MSNANLYCLFANKPASSWSGSWGAYEEYYGWNISEVDIDFIRLMSRLVDIFHCKATLRCGEDGFDEIRIFIHDPTTHLHPSHRYYRLLTDDEYQVLFNDAQVAAEARIEAETARAKAEKEYQAKKDSEDELKAKKEQFESLKKELGL